MPLVCVMILECWLVGDDWAQTTLSLFCGLGLASTTLPTPHTNPERFDEN
jgi:hypothetical protein